MQFGGLNTTLLVPKIEPASPWLGHGGPLLGAGGYQQHPGVGQYNGVRRSSLRVWFQEDEDGHQWPALLLAI